MTRLIEIDDPKDCAPSLATRIGDLLVFSASGGRVNTGSTVLCCLGPFMRAVVGTNRTVLEPAGPPNAVIFQARQKGQAAIDVISGDPFGATMTTTIVVIVEDHSA